MSSIPGLELQFPDINSGTTTSSSIHITDIILVTSKDLVPASYVKIERTQTTNKKCALHAHGPEQGLSLCIQRDPKQVPITGLGFVCDDHAESVPPGYIRIERTPSGKWAGLRSDKDDSRIFLCIKRGGASPPIVDIDFLGVTKNKLDLPPPNYVSIVTSAAGRDVKISGAKGGSFALTYRQQVLELGDASAMPALGVMLRALYTHDTTIVRHCLTTLQSIVKSSALFTKETTKTKTTTEEKQKETTPTQFKSTSVAARFISAVCDICDDAPYEHLEPLCALLKIFVQKPEFFNTTNHQGSPKSLLRIVGTITFLKATYGGHTTTSKATLVRKTLSVIMSTLMNRMDVTNPLGVDHVAERRLRKEAYEASKKSEQDGPVQYCLELILARVHELRHAMVAAHDAVIASLTLGGSKSVIAPYSQEWRVQMDVIGRRIYPGHSPPRDVFAGLAFLCQLCHVDVPTKLDDVNGDGNDRSENSPTQQSDLRTKVYALQSLRTLLEKSGVGFRQGDRSGLVVR